MEIVPSALKAEPRFGRSDVADADKVGVSAVGENVANAYQVGVGKRAQRLRLTRVKS